MAYKTGGDLEIKSSRSKTIAAAMITAILICLTGLLIFYAWQQYQDWANQPDSLEIVSRTNVDETEVSEEEIQQHQVPAQHPRYISVPQLNINKARVVNLGLIDGTNQLDSPISIFDAGWYNQSAAPGSGGGALLLNGHNGGPTQTGIFDQLGELQIGAEIIIERGDGQIYTYLVADNRQITLEQANDQNNQYGMATMMSSAETSKQGLNIITCVGEWLPAENTYDSRVMLRAVLAD